VVYAYHKVFNPEARAGIEEQCKAGAIGCVACKKLLIDVLNRFLAPIRERRAGYEKDPDSVWDILNLGTVRACEEGAKTMGLVREAMKLTYEK
jgi:tryptophanyl-tRNA synthetase